MELKRKNNCMIFGSKVRLRKKITELLWFVYAGRRHERPKIN